MSDDRTAKTLQQVNDKALELAKIDNESERGWAHFGYLMLEVAEMGYWQLKYDRFQDYIKDVAVVARKTPAQLKRYFLTVRDLSGVFTPEQLEKVGITKAMKVRSALDYAIVLPSSVINAALDQNLTATDLKKVISTTLKMPEEEGIWMDCKMEFMVSTEQQQFIQETLDIAKHTEPLTKSTISEDQQNLDVMMKLCMEFRAGHNGDGN